MGLFEKIFDKALERVTQTTHYKLLESWNSSFTPFNGNQWNISHVRSAVGAFARNAAKVLPKHIRRGGGTFQEVNGNLKEILQRRPNPYMTAYAFYYKIACQYKLTNNAFIWPKYDTAGNLIELYPVMAQIVELVEYKGEMYCLMSFASGKRVPVPYCEMIHIRNNFYDNDIFGSDNEALKSVLETATTFNQSMSKFAKLISVIRGILKLSTIAKEKERDRIRKEFVEENLTAKNNEGGIVVIDSTSDFISTDGKQTPIPTGQLQYIREEIFSYFGVNEAIVQNKYKEDEWSAFYESELEPFFIQLSQAMTNAIFTERERGFGNEIACNVNRLQFASTKTKVAASEHLTNIGAIMLDEVREIFGMAPIGGEEGRRRVQTLNMVNADMADAYQLGIEILKAKQKAKQEEDNEPDKQSDGTEDSE